jgi:hypothetical protein
VLDTGYSKTIPRYLSYLDRDGMGSVLKLGGYLVHVRNVTARQRHGIRKQNDWNKVDSAKCERERPE